MERTTKPAGDPRRVTAALIQRGGKVLLARRRPGRHMGRRWEFPGGKIDPGESPEQALSRELAEEFGVEARVGALLASGTFRQGALHLELLLFRIEEVAGAFRLLEHEEIRWVAPQEVEGFDLVDSDRFLYRRLRERGLV